MRAYVEAYDDVDADGGATDSRPSTQLDWLSQPLSGRSLSWTVDALVVVAALLLFVLVFLSVTREPPRWPLAMVGAAAVVVAVLYWGFFQLFGGSSPGARLARMAGSDLEDDAEASGARFR
jgi:protein-S-isoprenylcysteine O-methyltransferase Ste14